MTKSKKCVVCGIDFYPRKDKFDRAKTCSRTCCCKYAGDISRKNQLEKWANDTPKEVIEKMRLSLEKFFEKGEGCWNWIGGTKGSGRLPYGNFTFRGKRYTAHRAAWMIYKGEITNDLWVLHKCDNPKCVNPDHLYLGTALNNQRDKLERGRCIGERLTIEQVKEIKEKLDVGITSTRLSKDYNVSMTTMHSIKTGKTWKDI